jgi:hypothetical protein
MSATATLRYVWVWALVIAGFGCGGSADTWAYRPGPGPCDLGIITQSGGGLSYATQNGMACPELGPGPDDTTCWDPYALRAPDAGGDLGTYRCCSGKGIDVDQANMICTAIAGD